jgi:hypothetical protein
MNTVYDQIISFLALKHVVHVVTNTPQSFKFSVAEKLFLINIHLGDISYSYKLQANVRCYPLRLL